MSNIEVKLRGTRADIDELISELRGIEGVAEVSIDHIEPAKPNILERRPQGQLEVVDLVVGFLLNVGASYTYDKIRAIIADRAKKKGFDDRA